MRLASHQVPVTLCPADPLPEIGAAYRPPCASVSIAQDRQQRDAAHPDRAGESGSLGHNGG